MRSRPIEERIAEKQIRRKGCWGWTGAKRSGYPAVCRGGQSKGLVYVHRFMMGEPKGRLVLHKCDNPECTNPAHLEVGTYSKNIQDAYDRGLRPSPHNMKVSNEDIIAAEFTRALTGATKSRIAKALGIARWTYSDRLKRLRRKGQL